MVSEAEIEAGPVINTDRELWRERPDDYYAPALFVTAGGGIGMDVGGHCIVLPIRAWHRLALQANPTDDRMGERRGDPSPESNSAETLPSGIQEIIFIDPIRGGVIE